MPSVTAVLGRLLRAVAVVATVVHAQHVHAAGDEIQVYIDDIRARGEGGLELHTNYVPRGRLTPDYPGEQPPGRILRVTPEFSFGLGNNFDVGLYVPFSANNESGSTFSDYAKLRGKYLVNNERLGASEFYGLNVEIARSPRRVSPARWSAEFRGILGMRRGDWLLAVNPIIGMPLDRSVADNTVDFDVSTKVAKEVGGGLALGIEHYAELGPVRKLTFGPDAGQTTFAVVDYEGKNWGVNFGVGHGWTGASDRRVVKMILGLPL